MTDRTKKWLLIFFGLFVLIAVQVGGPGDGFDFDFCMDTSARC